MLKEWMITLRRYFQRANSVLAKDINGKSFPKGNLIVYKLAFWGIACVIVAFLPQGLSDGFIDYIKDIFVIFVGFFSCLSLYLRYFTAASATSFVSL